MFLRVLKYYAGNPFLTTNRVGDFDEAFASRNHMSLYYPELDLDKTREVFKLNLDLIYTRFTRSGRTFKADEMNTGVLGRPPYPQGLPDGSSARRVRDQRQIAHGDYGPRKARRAESVVF